MSTLPLPPDPVKGNVDFMLVLVYVLCLNAVHGSDESLS